MNTSLLIILRVLHVVGGAIRVGVTEIFRFFIQPAVKALAKESQEFGQALNDRNRFLNFIGAITPLNILSGFVLFTWSQIDSIGSGSPAAREPVIRWGRSRASVPFLLVYSA